jgi:hypothetical protein
MDNSPEKLIELAKKAFPSPILLLTSSNNTRLWEMSECSKSLPVKGAWRSYKELQGMKFRGPGWEIHLQEVENELHRYCYDYDFDHEQCIPSWDREGRWCRT